MLLPFKKSVEHIHVGLFLDLLFIDLCIYSSINKPCLDYCSLMGNLEISQRKTSLFFFKIILAILDPLYFYMNFRIGLLISTK